MKTRRVGSISMALSLIFFGILLFISQFSKLSAVELAVKVWPIILIIIGLEVLYFAYKNREEENYIIRYDIFSIFIVFTILMVNIGLYGLMETGILDYVKVRLAEETAYYQELNN